MSIPQQYVRERWIAQNDSWQQTYIQNYFFLQTLRYLRLKMSVTITFVGRKQQNSWKPSFSNIRTLLGTICNPLYFEFCLMNWIMTTINHQLMTYNKQCEIAHRTSQGVAKGSEFVKTLISNLCSVIIQSDRESSRFSAVTLGVCLKICHHIFNSFQSYHSTLTTAWNLS